MPLADRLSLDHWLRPWQRLGAPPAGLPAIHAELLAAHRQPHRHYHTDQHLAECLTRFDTVRDAAIAPEAIELALWFHDAIYDPQQADNEARSADWAAESMTVAGLPAKAVAQVLELILATRHTSEPLAADAQLLVDIDLSILAAPRPRFAEYEAQVRAEYAAVPQAIFCERRAELLEAFLARERLFTTATLAELEGPARANLAWSIEQLRSSLPAS